MIVWGFENTSKEESNNAVVAEVVVVIKFLRFKVNIFKYAKVYTF